MSRGFTLLELLVVLAVIGLVMVAVPMMIAGGRPGPETRSAAIEIASALRQTRSESIARFQPTTFLVDVDARNYRVGKDGAVKILPEEMALSLYTARSELADDSQGGIRFFPDGSATGGRVTVTKGGHSYTVAVDWLTGVVTVDQQDAEQ